MRCINCGAFSLRLFCASCARTLSQNRLNARVVEDFVVFYYYGYSEVKNLILSKHHLHGSAVLSHLAKFSLAKFPNEFKAFLDENLPNLMREIPNFKFQAVPLDDDISSGFSHTAVLARALKSREITPAYGVIKAQNKVKYAGQSLEFRLKHRRDYKITKEPKFPVILVDDIVTTGLSMLEAREVLKRAGFRVVFGIVLANAQI